jgi:hypothetical protein
MVETIFSNRVRVALQGVQNAEENCNKVALDPRGAPIMDSEIELCPILAFILPRER